MMGKLRCLGGFGSLGGLFELFELRERALTLRNERRLRIELRMSLKQVPRFRGLELTEGQQRAG